jgi:hypothetical protein
MKRKNVVKSDIKQVPLRITITTPSYETLKRGTQARNPNGFTNLGENSTIQSVRISNEDIKNIERACELLGGVKLTSFIRQAAVGAANAVLECEDECGDTGT